MPAVAIHGKLDLRVEDVITHEVPAGRAAEAFAAARDSAASGKVPVSLWPGEDR